MSGPVRLGFADAWGAMIRRIRHLAFRAARGLCALGVVLALAACQTELYTDLTEREANDLLAALLAEGIDARKVAVEDGVFSVTVEESQVRDALAILDSQGLPRGDRSSIGQVFAGGGIVSSPFEERVRFIYALGEEVGQTLQQIDGVMVARVHIVMPEAPELGQELTPASAAVFIKQRPGYDLDFLMPQVRRLVANSIEGLSYDEVTVVLVEAQPPVMTEREQGVELVELLPGLRVEAAAVGRAWMLGGGLGGVVLLLAGVVAFLGLRLRSARRAQGAGADLA